MTATWNDIILLCLKHRFCSVLLFVSLILTAYQSFISKHSSCLALLSFNNLCLFNLLRILSHLIGLWSDSQLPDSQYSYGFIRVRVVAVFSSLVLMALLACCTLRGILVFLLISNRDVLTSCSSASNAFLLGLEVLVLTAVISGTMSASPIDCVVRASASTAAKQPFFASLSAISKTHLGKTWRSRSGTCGVLQHQLCPVLLLVLGSWLMLVTHSATASFLYNLFEQASTSSFVLLLDTLTALCILLLAASYLWQPLLLSIRVLMQAVSVGSSSALQHGLHRAATLDGVLELRSTRVWALTPHCLRPHSALSSKSEALVCCVLVRLQRDADPPTVVGQLRECLQHCVVHLTVQVYKDEWVQASSTPGLPQHASQFRPPPGLMNSKISTRTATSRVGSTLPPPSSLPLSVLPVVPSAVSSTHSSHDRPALYDHAKIRNLSTTVCEPPLKVYYQALPTQATFSSNSGASQSISSSHNNYASGEPTTVVLNPSPTPCLASHSVSSKSFSFKKGAPSPHYVNVNLPPCVQDTRGAQNNSSRTPSDSPLQCQTRLDTNCMSISVDPYKSDFHSESYASHSNVSDDQKSNFTFSKSEGCGEHPSDALLNPSPVVSVDTNSVLLRNSSQNSSMGSSMGLNAKWPYGSRHDLDEHAYVNIEFTDKS